MEVDTIDKKEAKETRTNYPYKKELGKFRGLSLLKRGPRGSGLRK